MSANDFQTDLEWSESQHSSEWWEPYYKKAFPTMVSVIKVPGPSSAQRAGVDKFVVLPGGKKVAVDEKVRRNRDGSDIGLEYEHVPVNGESPWPGWIEKTNTFTDFVAMGFPTTRLAFFFPFLPLQTAWKQNGPSWKFRFDCKPSANPKINPRYHTWNCYVPTEVVLGTILQAIRVQL